jgi:hypothetical protein
VARTPGPREALPRGVVVTQQDQEPSGDYGYDMAHEQTRGAPAPEESRRQRHATPGPTGTTDRGEDYGYDEAHGF